MKETESRGSFLLCAVGAGEAVIQSHSSKTTFISKAHLLAVFTLYSTISISIQFHRMPREKVEPRGGQTVTTTKKN